MISNFARHHMRNHRNANAIALEMAYPALRGASTLACDFFAFVFCTRHSGMLSVQESPAMRVQVMGVKLESLQLSVV